MDRLQKILSAAGVCSRRQAEAYLTAGRVAVNGRISSLGDKADPDRDRITVDGAPIPRREAHIYLMLHKPRGYVTTLSDEKGRHTAADLVKDCGVRVYPVGRLDLNSEGLLLMTNDGELAQRMTHPSHEVSKTYHVSVSGAVEGAGFLPAVSAWCGLSPWCQKFSPEDALPALHNLPGRHPALRRRFPSYL